VAEIVTNFNAEETQAHDILKGKPEKSNQLQNCSNGSKQKKTEKNWKGGHQ
jgi:hypothetical protein